MVMKGVVLCHVNSAENLLKLDEAAKKCCARLKESGKTDDDWVARGGCIPPVPV
jgi:hypothetical protein